MDFRSDPQSKCTAFPHAIGQEIRALRRNVLKSNLIDFNELYDAEFSHYLNWRRQTDGVEYSTVQQQRQESHQQQQKSKQQNFYSAWTALSVGAMLCLIIGLMLLNFHVFIEYFTSIRCFLPNNYMIWEATRPISNCQFCAGVSRPLILSNLSQTEFSVSQTEPESFDSITEWREKWNVLPIWILCFFFSF